MKSEQYALMRKFEEDFFWFAGLHELVLSLLGKLSLPGKPPKIFDAGCGTGGLLNRMDRIGEAAGMDFSDEALRFCRQRGLTNAVLGNLNDWIPPQDRYDVITCLDVLYHAGVLSDLEVLKKFHEALKPEGAVIINVPAFEVLRRLHDEKVETKKRYRKEELRELLEKAGFEVETLTYRLPALFPVLLSRKLLTCFSGSSSGEDIRALPKAVNEGLLKMHRWENRRILDGGTFCFGSSLFAVARKRCR